MTKPLTGTPEAIQQAIRDTERKLQQRRKVCHDPRHETPCTLPCAACAIECDRRHQQ